MASYSIELIEFPKVPVQESARRLAEAFQIPLEQALSLVQRAPVKVKSDASPRDAQSYVSVLLSIGADVRVSGEGQTRVYRAAEVRSRAPGTGQPIRPVGRTSASGPHPLPAGILGRRAGKDHIICPRCGHRQPPGDACVKCGVVYAKYNTRHARAGGGVDEQTESGAYRLPTGERRAVGADGQEVPGANPYLASPEDDDSLFDQPAPVFKPAELLQPPIRRAEVSGAHALPRLARSSSGEHAAVAPGTALRQATGVAAERRRGSSDVGFWNKIGVALLFSLQGPAYQWLITFFVLGSAMGAALIYLPRIPFPFLMVIVALVVSVVLFSAFLGTQWRFFLSAFAEAVSGDEEAHQPMVSLADFRSELVMPGFVLVLAAVILWSPFLYVIIDAAESGPLAMATLSPVKILLLSLLPIIYWPMGMTYVTAYGRLTEVFIVTGIVKSMAIGGLEYVFVAALGVGAMAAMNLFITTTADFYHLGILFLLLGYCSGVQGFLMGKLVRRRPHLVPGAAEVEEVE